MKELGLAQNGVRCSKNACSCSMFCSCSIIERVRLFCSGLNVFGVQALLGFVRCSVSMFCFVRCSINEVLKHPGVRWIEVRSSLFCSCSSSAS